MAVPGKFLLIAVACLLPAAGLSQFDAALDDNVDEILTIEDDPELIQFSTEVSVVTVPVVVKGPKGVYVNGLESYDFSLFDNGKEQQITGFDVSFLPISMVVCVQSSDRVAKIIDQVRKTAVLFTDAVLGEFGQAAVISFDSRLKVLSDFTDETAKIDKALNRFTIGSSGIRTSDAVYEGIRMLTKRPENHKKVIVLIAEGLDNGSYINLGETLRTAQLHNITVYPIYLSTLKARLKRPPPVPTSGVPPGISPIPVAPGAPNTPTAYQQSRWSATPNVLPLIADLVIGIKNLVFKDALAVLARGTGGEDFKPITDEGLQNAIVKIGEHIRSQYLLTYTPNNLNDGGIFHEIEVRIPYPKAKVQNRPGYFRGPRAIPTGDPVYVE